MLTMDQVNMRNQRVLIRLDLNVPLESGSITSFIRINKALPTLKKALSIANVNPDVTVLTSFSVSNLNNMGEVLGYYK